MNMFRQRKGQAAMEFLMTYGWAILVVLVVIGALAYFDVLNPQKFVPSRCDFSSSLRCEGMRVSAVAANNQVALANLFEGKDIQITAVELGANKGSSGIYCSSQWASAGMTPVIVENGATFRYIFPAANCNNGGLTGPGAGAGVITAKPGSKINGYVMVNFTVIGTGLNDQVNGTFFQEVTT